MEQSFQQLRSASNIPSREELLAIVRKHSESLAQQGDCGRVGGSEGSLDSRLWKELMDLFFIRGAAAAQTSHDDDLVFFVRAMNSYYRNGGGLGEEESEPCFVRRWAPMLDRVIGEDALAVDWRRTFYLNLIAHTSYSLTVAICSSESLENYRNSTTAALMPIYKVTKRVYASPSRVDFQRNHSKGSETVVAYPDVYFEVDSCDDTFDSVILKQEGDCFCVILHAYGGAAIPGAVNASADDENFGGCPVLVDRKGSDSTRVTLFSAFVKYELVCSAFETGKGNLGSLLHLGDNEGRSERLIMRGPGGRGQVDVILSCVPSAAHEKNESLSSVAAAKGSMSGVEAIFHKAFIVAKNAYVAASSAGKSADNLLTLRCCLLSLSLPWDSLAYDLLFKHA